MDEQEFLSRRWQDSQRRLDACRPSALRVWAVIIGLILLPVLAGLALSWLSK